MDATLLTTKFARIGARLTVADRPPGRFRSSGPVALDVRADRRGEYFEVARRAGDDLAVEVLDVRPADRHLLLLVRDGTEKGKFLCGHDERHWFVAAVPEAAPVGTVRQAMEALKPPEVRAAQAVRGVSGRAATRRKTAAYVRQGEWFFVPVPGFAVDTRLVLTDEPLRRGWGGKPHWVDRCYRTGGETVHVCARHPNGVTEAEYRALLLRTKQAAKWGWRVMRRNPGVYVTGRVRHPDHQTILLRGWHRVQMNTEGEARAMRNVAFLD